jgi:uncharacterized protein (DUF2126 family)
MSQCPDGPWGEAPIVAALSDLDARIEALGAAIWIGGEPTFTDRFSEAPEWLHSALGGVKEARAGELLRAFAASFPGCALLRTLGRQYPGEPEARWSLGLLTRRNGSPLWQGPPDPLLAPGPGPSPDLDALRLALLQAAAEQGWLGEPLDSPTAPRTRLLLRRDGVPPQPSRHSAELLQRPSVHAGPIPAAGLRDPLAELGDYLILLDTLETAGEAWVTLELPACSDTGCLLGLLALAAQGALAAGLTGLVLRGHPPPMDRHLHWSSLTPDPAVIEANLAPAADATELYRVNQTLFQAAEGLGLAPYRLHYNGRETDSGGGGQLTIGGPTPEASPFFLEPRLLPRLVRYFNHHPALSYWLAPESVGSGSQAPRPDEGPRERWLELAVALEQLERRPFPDPSFLWASLAPFLADSAGNSHRSEINIEKLWNPHLGSRGLLGLVELRPFRMAPDASTFAAEGALLRAIVARLMHHPYEPPLMDWGDRLHSHFSLPHHLTLDLLAVLADLERHGLGLGEPLRRLLLDDSQREIGHLLWRGVCVRVLSALEFWPLIGDVTAHQPSDSRLIDASTTRIELTLSSDPGQTLDGWELRVNGFAAPLRREPDPTPMLLAGIRYRSFVPWQGLHPRLPAVDRVELVLVPPEAEQALCVTLFEWRPKGGPYLGLPQSREEARRRRDERLVVTEVAAASLPPAHQPPAGALGECCFDLRRVWG